MSTSSQPGLNYDEITTEEWDAARRMRDAVNRFAEEARTTRAQRTRPPFIAIDLADGRCPDGTLYDSRPEAVAGQKGNKYRFFVAVPPDGMGVKAALVCLMYARRAFKAGYVFAEEEPVMPQRLEVAQLYVPRTVRGMRGGKEYRRG
jgi:hypothetical protein